MKKTIQSLEAFRANELNASISTNVLGGAPVCTGGGFMQSQRTGTSWFTWTSDETDGDTTTYFGCGDSTTAPGGGTGSKS